MLKIIFIIAILITAQIGFTQDINFFEGTFEEALEEAKRTKKPLFVDFYADWCLPCKQMEKYSFNNEVFSELINTKFLPLKIDIQYFWGLDVAESYDVSLYPTILFTDKKGKMLERLQGFQSAEELIFAAQKVLKL